MFERYTFEVPAIPDPEFTPINPEPEQSFEERMLAHIDANGDQYGQRAMFERLIEAKKPGPPKEAFDYSRYYFERTGAQSFMDQYSVYFNDGTLDINATSAKIGIPYTFEMRYKFARGEIVGLRNSEMTEPIEIHLNKDYNRNHLPVTFGHEIAHYYWQDVLRWGEKGAGRDPVEENFCDYFGRRMALPENGLRAFGPMNEESLLAMMSKYDVDLTDLILQLMDYGLLPKRVAIDSYNGRVKNADFSEKVTRGFVCAHCDIVGGDYNCPQANDPTPLFDFTDRAWGGNLSSCLGEKTHNPSFLSTLTKYYMAKETQLILFRPGALHEDD